MTEDILAGNVKDVKWMFVGIKRDEIVNLQWGIKIAVDNSKSLARVIIKIFGHGGSDLFVGDIGEAEERFERIARRLGAVDLLAEPLPSIHDACDRCSTQNSGAHLESVWLCEVCREVTAADKEIISYLRRYIKTFRAAATFALSAIRGHSPADDIPGDIVHVLVSDLRALRDALEGAEGVGDDHE